MKSTKYNSISLKQRIIATAHNYNEIQEIHCDPLIKNIESLLAELYPAMNANQRIDWALEFINFYQSKDVFERIENYLKDLNNE